MDREKLSAPAKLETPKTDRLKGQDYNGDQGIRE
jgi:hypothetical protein